ncbi:MAG TPA: ankyrin repeat domain-containing protein [Abditibacteriaceae bacterium]|jgi:hypothetical protein
MFQANKCPQCGELNGARATQCVVCGAVLLLPEDLTAENGVASFASAESLNSAPSDKVGKDGVESENHGELEDDGLEGDGDLGGADFSENSQGSSWRNGVIAVTIGLLLLGTLAAYLFATQAPKKTLAVATQRDSQPTFEDRNRVSRNTNDRSAPDTLQMPSLPVTSLYEAALFGDEGATRKRLAEGVNVNEIDAKTGWTPLMAAASRGKEQVLRLLLEHKADVRLTNKNGETALYLASVFGNAGCIRLLADAGSDVNTFSVKGGNPLLLATAVGHTSAVLALLDKGANPNVKAKEGAKASPLILASGYGHVEIVRALLSKGADITATDENNVTALQAATRMNHMDVVQLLQQAGAVK